jgi:hypothetical protein
MRRMMSVYAAYSAAASSVRASPRSGDDEAAGGLLGPGLVGAGAGAIAGGEALEAVPAAAALLRPSPRATIAVPVRVG